MEPRKVNEPEGYVLEYRLQIIGHLISNARELIGSSRWDQVRVVHKHLYFRLRAYHNIIHYLIVLGGTSSCELRVS